MSFANDNSTITPKTPPVFQRSSQIPRNVSAEDFDKKVVEVKELTKTIERLNFELAQKKRELEEAQQKKSVFFSQQHIENLEKTLSVVMDGTSSIGKVISWLNFSQGELAEFWSKEGKLDFAALAKADQVYKDCLPKVRKDLEGFNNYMALWNNTTVQIALMNKIRDWLLDASDFPTRIDKLQKEVEAFKKTLEPIHTSDVYNFDASDINTLQELYKDRKQAFAILEKQIMAIEEDDEFPHLLKKMVNIIHQNLHKSTSPFSALRPSHSLASFQLNQLDAVDSTGWVTENNEVIEGHERKLYNKLFDATWQNWFLLIKDTIILKSILQCLGETIELTMPIRHLQKETVGLRSVAKTEITATRKTTKTIGHADLEALKDVLGKLEVTFKQCLTNKATVEKDFAGASKRLEETNKTLAGRLQKQASMLIEQSLDSENINEQVVSLQKFMQDKNVMISDKLDTAWKEILTKLPETAAFLDRLDYGVYYKGKVPDHKWFYFAYKISSGKYWKMMEAGPEQPVQHLSINLPPQQVPVDEIDQIPVKQLILNDDE